MAESFELKPAFTDNRPFPNPVWFRLFKASVPHPSLRIIAFPPAGGAPGSFTALRDIVDPDVECSFIILPGREARMTEPPAEELLTVADSIATELISYIGRSSTPVILLGQSMGGILAYEVALRLIPEIGRKLLRVVVAASASPSHVSTKSFSNSNPHRMLKDLGAPEELFLTGELLELVVQALSADLKMLTKYRSDGRTLSVPITVLLGSKDDAVRPKDATEWLAVTEVECTQETLEGGHFFLDAHYEKLLSIWLIEAASYNDALKEAAHGLA